MIFKKMIFRTTFIGNKSFLESRLLQREKYINHKIKLFTNNLSYRK